MRRVTTVYTLTLTLTVLDILAVLGKTRCTTQNTAIDHKSTFTSTNLVFACGFIILIVLINFRVFSMESRGQALRTLALSNKLHVRNKNSNEKTPKPPSIQGN